MLNRSFLVSLLALSAALVSAGGVAHADGPKLHLERSDVSHYPIMKLYLSYVEADGRMVTGKTRENFKLTFDSNEQAAADVKTIEQTGEPVYMVMVAQVSGAMSEVFEDEKRGLKMLATSAAELKGSQVALLAYAQDVKRIAELGKPEDIDAKVTALQVDTDGTEVHLLEGIRTAIDLLNAKGVPDDARKIIVVFSDGIDVSGSEKKGYTELGKRAQIAGVAVYTIGYAPFEIAKLKNLNEIAKQSLGTERVCKSAQDVSAQLANAADQIKKQYVALFSSVIAGDGKEHTFQVVDEVGGKSVISENVTKICENHGPPPEKETPFWKKWWFWLFCVVLPFLLIIILIVRMLGNKEAPMPMPIEQGPAPMESNSNRTMALDLGVLSGKGPTIGWIVGINGKYADQTFKLKPSRTLLGTAADSDIVIDDSFMSGKHCEVRYDGSNYKIVDLGSTNGVVLNDKKVMEHDLVDGDTVRLGRTEFRFKSIN